MVDRSSSGISKAVKAKKYTMRRIVVDGLLYVLYKNKPKNTYKVVKT